MTKATLTAGIAAALIALPTATRFHADDAGAWQQAAARRNVIFILSDDHRYDFMGFNPDAPRWLPTPALDRMAAYGAHLRNAFVTTALCSPSRASILTGRYAHRHGVVDNTSPIPKGTVFFPQYLQQAGYRTAYIGKWHMGEERGATSRAPVSTTGSVPRPGRLRRTLAERQRGAAQVQGYTTDILTESAVSWLEAQRGRAAPFFLFLSHKAVHAEFEPPPRHQGRYAKCPSVPRDDGRHGEQLPRKARWVGRSATAGTAWTTCTTGSSTSTLLSPYAETLLALDESVGRVLDYLERSGLARNTLVIYMGDNGFLLGEHGLIDKRNAYEESMRVPMLAYAPGMIGPGSKVRPSSATSTSRRRSWSWPVRGRSTRWTAAPCSPRCAGDVAGRRVPLRVLLGVRLSAHADDLRAARRPLQVHLLSRRVGPERVYDLRTDSRAQQPDQRAGLPEADRPDADPALRSSRRNRWNAGPLRRGNWQAAERRRRWSATRW